MILLQISTEYRVLAVFVHRMIGLWVYMRSNRADEGFRMVVSKPLPPLWKTQKSIIRRIVSDKFVNIPRWFRCMCGHRVILNPYPAEIVRIYDGSWPNTARCN